MTESKTSRRGFIGALAMSGAAIGTGSAIALPGKLSMSDGKKETGVACLYHCEFGDPARFSQMITNINNHLSAYEFDTLRVKIVVVVHAAGLKFFLADRSGTPWEKDVIDDEIYKR